MLEEIEEAIMQVRVENESASKNLSNLDGVIDNYLDQAIEQRNRFNKITLDLSALNDSTIEAFNNNQDEAYRLLPSMRILLEACLRNLSSLKSNVISKAIQATIDNFEDEVDQLRENINDFITIHDELPNDPEWKELLSAL